ncbi:hypothetical protein ADU59_25200 [Pararhizobium polonicum]|uniref:Uncharacterized protein n=1 Tax=Pararhizobium polonicum TaxID=1612624 RepID=A0A1C7NUJ6_9HYPH|nr:hypothetical protein ADU59_25200 [Pararhizobium polonicum]
MLLLKRGLFVFPNMDIRPINAAVKIDCNMLHYAFVLKTIPLGGRLGIYSSIRISAQDGETDHFWLDRSL